VVVGLQALRRKGCRLFVRFIGNLPMGPVSPALGVGPVVATHSLEPVGLVRSPLLCRRFWRFGCTRFTWLFLWALARFELPAIGIGKQSLLDFGRVVTHGSG